MTRNLTGTPNTKDYSLGRGVVSFATLLLTGYPGAYRDLGNSPEFIVTTTVTTLDHESSRRGLKVVDQTLTITEKVEVKFKLDELNDENVAVYLSGSEVTPTNAAIGGFASYQMIAGVALGRWYDLIDSSGNRAWDVLAANLSVNDDASSTNLVLDPNYNIDGSIPAAGTDYALDATMGRIFFFSQAAHAMAGDNIHVRITARPGASPVNQVAALTQVSVVGALKFISINPAADGRRREYQFHQIRLKANGDVNLISDTYSELDLIGTAERNTSLPGAPTLTVSTVTTPSS